MLRSKHVEFSPMKDTLALTERMYHEQYIKCALNAGDDGQYKRLLRLARIIDALRRYPA